MRLTRRTDYAIHLIAVLAAETGKPLGLRALAERHGVTYAYARTVQQGLLRAGIIKTARGVNGGIVLAKELGNITLLDVFEAAQDPLDLAFATDDSPWCECPDACISDGLWLSTQRLLGEHLAGITMQQVVSGGAGV